MTSYVFSIHDDFPNHALASDRLTIEIGESAIVTALDGISTSGDVCDIVFKAALSEGDEALLEGLVAAHSGLPLPQVTEVRTTDGKLYVSPDMWPLGTLTNFTGAADDVTNGVVGTDLLAFSSTAVEDNVKAFQFILPSYLAGGHLQYQGAVFGDWIDFTSVVPATAGVSNPGAGNFNKVQVGAGANVFVPSVPGSGNWDLDLTAKENANVTFTKVRPVPAPGMNGYFDHSIETGAVVLNATGHGGYHLCDYEVTLARFITRVSIMGSDHFPLTVPAVRPILILPHWLHRVTVHNSTTKTLHLVAMLYRGLVNPLR
jgi:hypothetical protein